MSNKKTVTIDNQVYKIGLHGKVFVKRGDDWVRSLNYTSGEVLHRMKGPKVKK
ncbi:MAG: hypothetical protein K0U20_08650 [Proteobacteria bacterium]|nr:hypothetical protein [Pseudomonadota bacterium]